MDIEIKVVDERRQCVVVGGGSAGWVAAVAAARNGAQVLLIERYGYLGGTAASVALSGFGGLYSGETREQHIFGIPDELLQRLQEYGGSAGVVPEGWTGGSSPYDKELLKQVAMDMAVEAGVELLLHTRFVDAVVEDGRMQGVVVAAKDGLHYIPADVVIDASGDGDVFAAAGAAYDKGASNGKMQPTTMTFKVGGVDTEGLLAYVRANPEKANSRDLSGLPTTLGGFKEEVAAAIAAGEYQPNMDQLAIHFTFRSTEVALNMLHTTDIDGTDPWSLTRSEVEGRRQVLPALNFLRRRIPGFADAYLIETAVHAGTRESRRLIGEYVLTKEDILAGRTFTDAVISTTGTMSYHDPEGKLQTTVTKLQQPYQIPYRCLVPRDLDGLLVAGRCVSVDNQGLSTVRSAGVALALGQVAGTAAALALAEGIQPREVDAAQIRDRIDVRFSHAPA